MHSAFRVAFGQLETNAREIARHFGQRGHTAQMDHLELQMLERVREFEEAVGRDRGEHCCDGCGRGSAKLGEACDHCGEIIECSIS